MLQCVIVSKLRIRTNGARALTRFGKSQTRKTEASSLPLALALSCDSLDMHRMDESPRPNLLFNELRSLASMASHPPKLALLVQFRPRRLEDQSEFLP